METSAPVLLDLSPLSLGSSLSTNESSFDKSDLNEQLEEEDFSPSSGKIQKKFINLELIYQEKLSPSVITLVQNTKTQESVVKKDIMKDKLFGENQLPQARIECVIHASLIHDNIVRLFDYTEDNEKIVMFMEYCNKAQQLEEQLDNKKKEIKDEQQLKSYVKQILEALKHIHSQGIVHADIKPANILLHQDNSENSTVKIADFGVSQKMNKEDDGTFSKALMKDLSGTRLYMAPELKKANTIVGPEIDMWSFGVLLYQMCVGYLPTQVKEYKYGSGPLPFRPRDWKRLSNKGETVFDLVNKCLNIDPESRITSAEALDHPFLQG